MDSTIIDRITARNGVAGQVRYDVETTGNGWPTTVTVFVGSVYGGPIHMIMEGWELDNAVRVTRPERFGPQLNEQWVRNFYA